LARSTTFGRSGSENHLASTFFFDDFADFQPYILAKRRSRKLCGGVKRACQYGLNFLMAIWGDLRNKIYRTFSDVI
jgi:hypothetical protein